MQTSSSPPTADRDGKSPSWNATPYASCALTFAGGLQLRWWAAVLEGQGARRVGEGSQCYLEPPADTQVKWLVRALSNNLIALISARLYQFGSLCVTWRLK